MRKSVFRILGVVVCTMMLLSCVACQRNSESGASESITGLNQFYLGKVLKVAVTDMNILENSVESDSIIIETLFDIENISANDFLLYNSSITAYVDGVATERAWASNSEELSRTTIAPGKRAVGHFTVNASKDAEKIELHCDEGQNNPIVFVFDIATIEKGE
jgi:archaellum component FlaG (FlaF/FlaG flagellin family)